MKSKIQANFIPKGDTPQILSNVSYSNSIQKYENVEATKKSGLQAIDTNNTNYKINNIGNSSNEGNSELHSLITQAGSPDKAQLKHNNCEEKIHDNLNFINEVSNLRNENKKFFLPPQQGRHKNLKTLFLDLDETLVHSSFIPIDKPDYILPVEIENKMYNIYVLKRKGVKELLRAMDKIYEVVVYTASLAKYASPLLDLLDEENKVSNRLFRDHCIFNSFTNSFVKDLSCSGRDLKKVIIVDNSPTAYSLQPSNGIPIVTWIEDKSDNKLIEIIPILELLSKVEDVRPFIRKIVKNNTINTIGAQKILAKEINIQNDKLSKVNPFSIYKSSVIDLTTNEECNVFNTTQKLNNETKLIHTEIKNFSTRIENKNYPNEAITKEIMKSIPTNCKLNFTSKLYLFHNETSDQFNNSQTNELKEKEKGKEKVNPDQISESNIVESQFNLDGSKNNLLINRKRNTQPIYPEKTFLDNKNKLVINRDSSLIVSNQVKNKTSHLENSENSGNSGNSEAKYNAFKFLKGSTQEYEGTAKSKVKQSDENEELTLVKRFSNKSSKLKEQTVVVRRNIGEETPSAIKNEGQNLIERKSTFSNKTSSNKNLTPKKKSCNPIITNPNFDQATKANLGKFYTPKKSSQDNLKNGSESNKISIPIQQNSSKNFHIPSRQVYKVNNLNYHLNSSKNSASQYPKKKYVRQVNRSPVLSLSQKAVSNLLYTLDCSHEMLTACENKHFINSRFNNQN